MRTSIDLPDDQRAALLAQAARRGLRGYSLLIKEAVAQYLAGPAVRRTSARRTSAGKKPDHPLVSWLDDGFTTGRPDGSDKHDDYIYGRPG